MAGKKILVPFNFTAYDERAIHYVIRTYAGQRNAEVTLFHVYAPLPDIDMSSPRLGSLRNTMAGMWKEIRERERELSGVKADLVENGFEEERIKTIFKPRTRNVSAEIVAEARQGSYNTVVMAREPGKATRILTSNVHDSLLTELRDTEIVIIT